MGPSLLEFYLSTFLGLIILVPLAVFLTVVFNYLYDSVETLLNSLRKDR